MTDENTAIPDAEGVDWGDTQAPTNESAPVREAAPFFAETTEPNALANHRFTISLVPDKAPMIVVRGNSAAEITAGLNELEAYGVYANLGAAYASMKAQGNLGGGLGPVTPVAPQAPPQGPPMGMPQVTAPPGAQGPTTPPPFGPNVSVPQAPGYQGPSVPAGPPAPPAGGWGGNGGGGNRGPQGPNPRPAGWFAADIPWAQKDAFKALRAQGTDTGNYLRGKIKWGGGGNYWVEPSVAQWLAQQGYPVTQ